MKLYTVFHAAAAKSLQLCPTLCDPIDSSPPGSPDPGILQARTLEWVVISLSNAWKWKVKVKFLSSVQPSETPWTAAFRASPSMGFTGKNTWVRCHCLLRPSSIGLYQFTFPPTVQAHFLFSTPSPAFTVCRLFDGSHSDRCEMVPPCGFDLHFSDNEWCWASPFTVQPSPKAQWFGNHTIFLKKIK